MSTRYPSAHEATMVVEPVPAGGARVLERTVRICHDRDLNLTPIRRRVLELLATSRVPIPAYTLIHQLALTWKPIGPPTVYRALEFLMEAGFVRYVALRKAYVCSELPEIEGPVALLTCTACGDVSEVDSGPLQGVIASLSATRGFDPGFRSIEIPGRCTTCRKAASA